MKALALLLFSSSLVHSAEPIKTPKIEIEGKIFQNCTITKVDAATAKILHAEGVSRVPISKLPAPQQTALGFDPKEAAKVAEREAAAKAKANEQEVANRAEKEKAAEYAAGAAQRRADRQEADQAILQKAGNNFETERAMLLKGSFQISITVAAIGEAGVVGHANVLDENGKAVDQGIIMVETGTEGSDFLTGRRYKFTARRMGTVSSDGLTVPKYKDLEFIIWQLKNPGQ